MTHPTVDDIALYFSKYRAEIYRFLFGIVQCEHIAHDLTQDTYLRLADYQGGREIENPRAFLYRIANNLAIDYLRAQSRQTQLFVETAADDVAMAPVDNNTPPDIIQNRQQLEILHQVINTLPDNCRDIIIRSRFMGQTHEQIASELGISKSWVEKNIIQALRLCKQALDNQKPN